MRERALIFSNNNNNNNNTRNLYIIKQQHIAKIKGEPSWPAAPHRFSFGQQQRRRQVSETKKGFFFSVPIYERDILWAKDCTTVQMRKVPVCVCNFFAAAAAPAPGEYKKRKQKEKEITNNCPLTKKLPAADGSLRR